MPTAAEMLSSVSSSNDSAYLLNRDLRITAVNEAFKSFALSNGGGDIAEHWQDVSVIEATPPVLREFFREAFERAWATGQRWEHDYECSSPDVYRSFRMFVYPIRGEYLAVVHSLRLESGHTQVLCPADPVAYTDQGVIKMCAHCRRVRHSGAKERWDWVPAYVGQPPSNVSHGLCNTCASYYWPARSAPPRSPSSSCQ